MYFWYSGTCLFLLLFFLLALLALSLLASFLLRPHVRPRFPNAWAFRVQILKGVDEWHGVNM